MTARELSYKQLLPLTAIVGLSLILTMSNFLIPLARGPENYGITIHDFSFEPQILCVEKGDTVVWINEDPVIYTLWFVFAENQSTYLLSDPIAPHQSWSHTFPKPARLLYYSFERLWVTGKLGVYSVLGDVDGDGTVDVLDLFGLGRAYSSHLSDPNWNQNCDFNWDDSINESDLFVLSENYGKNDP